jgi:hypothetical protein
MKNIELQGLTCFKIERMVDRSPLSETMKCLVLESDPNPVYYGLQNFPPNKEHVGDKHLYLLVKNKINCFQDVILRNAGKIREKFDFKMHIYPGSMTFQNKTYQCIRLDTTYIEQLPILINELKKLDLLLVKDNKVKAYKSLIYFKKFIEYAKVEDGVYQDKDNKNRYFFRIQKHLEFEDFIKGMKQIKNNCNFHLFDSFLTDMFYRNDVLDFIGIYSEHCDESRFGELKQQIAELFK